MVPSDPSYNVVGNKWVFRIKRKADGTIERLKARLVAKGFHQTSGLDFTKTFNLVVKPATIRILLSLALRLGWDVQQLDINNVFLNRELQEIVFMSQPEGCVYPSYPTHVCKLNKALYGLKQAP